jgi:hypothetical protein
MAARRWGGFFITDRTVYRAKKMQNGKNGKKELSFPWKKKLGK